MRSQRGITLVELLFTISVIALSGIGLLVAYQASLHLTEVSQQMSVAVNDLKDMTERIKTTAFTQLQNNFPTGVANGPGANPYTTIVGGYTLPQQQITVTHTPNVTADPRELTILITWTNRSRVYQRRISTIRASQAS